MKYDIAFLGSGPGGYVAAIRAAQLGMKTVVIEKENLGGVCLNFGCIPTKALLKSAHVYETVKQANKFGVKAENVSYDFKKIIQRSRTVARQMSKGVEFLFKKNGIDVVKGYGKIIDKGKIQVEGETNTVVEASHIVIATGARSRELPNLPLDGKKIIGYKQAMTLEEQPQSMVIVGAGAIGIEFAVFYATLGTKITLVEFLPRVAPLEDEEISAEIEKILKRLRIKVLTSSLVEEVQGEEKNLKVKIKTPQGEMFIDTEIVLSAVGITPNTENIGLENIGIKTEKGRITVDEFYRTNIDGFYAIGDVIPTPALAHVASAEGITCVEKIAGLDPQPIDYQNIPSGIFTNPEVASVGMTEKQALEQGYEIKTGKFPVSALGKATAIGSRDGFVKLVFDQKTNNLLGAHIIAPNATDMIAELVVSKKLGATGHQIIKSVHPHPTISEAIMEAAAAAYGEVIHI